MHVAFRKWEPTGNEKLPCLEQVPKEKAGLRFWEYVELSAICRLTVRLPRYTQSQPSAVIKGQLYFG